MRRRLSAMKRFCRSRFSATPGSMTSLTGIPASRVMPQTSKRIALHLDDAQDGKTWNLVFPRPWGTKLIIHRHMTWDLPKRCNLLILENQLLHPLESLKQIQRMVADL